MEISSSKSDNLEDNTLGKSFLQNIMECFLEQAYSDNLISNAVVAQNGPETSFLGNT